MLMFGKANWWFPRWLDRVLPRIHVEPEDLDELDEEAPSGELAPRPSDARPGERVIIGGDANR